MSVKTIHLYGALENAAGVKEINLDVDTPRELWSAIRRLGSLDLLLRSSPSVVIYETDADGVKGECVRQDFCFAPTTKHLHIATHTDGGYAAIPYIIEAIIAIVVSIGISMLMGKMKTNNNGAGGSKSTMFNGPVNNTDQGGAIPIVYGQMVLVGSTIISVGEDYYNQLSVAPDTGYSADSPITIRPLSGVYD